MLVTLDPGQATGPFNSDPVGTLTGKISWQQAPSEGEEKEVIRAGITTYLRSDSGEKDTIEGALRAWGWPSAE